MPKIDNKIYGPDGQWIERYFEIPLHPRRDNQLLLTNLGLKETLDMVREMGFRVIRVNYPYADKKN